MNVTAWRLLEDGKTEDGKTYIRAYYGNDRGYFSITGETHRNGRMESAGCLHDDISKTFPELAPFIKWHLVDKDGTPLHYEANSLFWFGRAMAGEPNQAKTMGKLGLVAII